MKGMVISVISAGMITVSILEDDPRILGYLQTLLDGSGLISVIKVIRSTVFYV